MKVIVAVTPSSYLALNIATERRSYNWLFISRDDATVSYSLECILEKLSIVAPGLAVFNPEFHPWKAQLCQLDCYAEDCGSPNAFVTSGSVVA